MVKRKNNNIPTSAIKYFWENYQFTSRFAEQPRNRKVNYQHYQTNISVLENFQVDLLTIPTRFTSENSEKYILGCVDTVSKYFFLYTSQTN